jgi:hypothetical protein
VRVAGPSTIGREPAAWEPEPLELPAEPPIPRGPTAREDERDEPDRTGSHVIVLEIA